MTAPDAAARSALLARLPAQGFVPSADIAPWSAAARAAAFAEAVEAFAAAYWSLEPDERRARFNVLWNGRYGPVAARLGLLEPGLNATRGGRAVTVEALVRELATLDLRVHDTPLATPPVATGSVVLPKYRGFERSVADDRADVRINRRLVVGVAAAVLLGALTLAHAWFPDLFPFDRPQPRTQFTTDEVRAYRAYHDGPRAGTLTVPPHGYTDWLAAGKPAARTPR
jgi:hypothetical protein